MKPITRLNASGNESATNRLHLDPATSVRLDDPLNYSLQRLWKFASAFASMRPMTSAKKNVAAHSRLRKRSAPTKKQTTVDEYPAWLKFEPQDNLKSLDALAQDRADTVIVRHFVTYSAYEDPI